MSFFLISFVFMPGISQPQDKSDIFRSRSIDGKYSHIENLGELINTEYHEWDPFIAPDESYLIFCSMKPRGFGGDDLYITFQTEHGT